MKRVWLVAAAAILSGFLPACATPSDPVADYQRISASLQVLTGPNGERVVSTSKSAEAQHETFYMGNSEGIAVWVKALKQEGQPAVVVLGGSRAFHQPHSEVNGTEPEGPWDRPDPAYIGTPWREADFRFSDRQSICYNAAAWCERRQQFDVLLSRQMVKDFIGEGAPDSIPIALFSRRDIDWRLPRVELLAALDALGVTDEFR